jgi:hypothetical protein
MALRCRPLCWGCATAYVHHKPHTAPLWGRACSQNPEHTLTCTVSEVTVTEFSPGKVLYQHVSIYLHAGMFVCLFVYLFVCLSVPFIIFF